MADVLLINMWTTDIGRYGASNYGLLKVVFEANLKLFDQASSKKLLFVLRDYDNRIDAKTIMDLLQKDINNIWSEIYKPEKYAESKPEDFFQFEYEMLPHKVFQPDDFTKACSDLKERFNVGATNTLFLSDSQQKNLPIDGLPIFVEKTWEVIKGEKDLNLPDQREIVANFRCNEIKDESYKLIAGGISQLKSECDAGIVEDFNTRCEEMISKATEFFGGQSKQYDKEVVAKIKDELLGHINSELYLAFDSQLKIIRNYTYDKVK